MDDFEELKERVRGLKFDVPSAEGCLKRLALEGIEGPMAEAAVEAVFNEAKDAARQRREDDHEPEDSASRSQRKLGSHVGMALQGLGVFAVSVVVGTLAMRYFSPSAGTISVLHILYVGATMVAIKAGQMVWASVRV
ncbi:MAG: hypothetical protein JKY65_00165 [Planctomycetes bacterium]|nr:hypothetical protein [Planctomycetota bacterium]